MLAINFNVSHIFPYLKFCVCLFFYVDGSPLGREYEEGGSCKGSRSRKGVGFLVKGQMSQIYQNFLIRKFSIFLRDFCKKKLELIELFFVFVFVSLFPDSLYLNVYFYLYNITFVTYFYALLLDCKI